MSDNGIKPEDVRYLSIPVTNADDTIERSHPDDAQLSSVIGNLIEQAKDEAEEHGCVTWIYEVKAIRKVYRGKVVVKQL